MFVAVDGYKRTKNPVILFMGVGAFILRGFERCVADMFYFSVAEPWTPDTALRVLVITLGNSLGGLLIPFFKRPLTLEVVRRGKHEEAAEEGAAPQDELETKRPDVILVNFNDEWGKKKSA